MIALRTRAAGASRPSAPHCAHATIVATTLAALLLVAAAPASAQTPERRTIPGNDVAIYNLAGVMRVEGGSGSDVTVEVTRRGGDASRLEIATGRVNGRETLRVIYPERRIVYRDANTGRGNSRTTLHVDEDGTFGHGGRGDYRRVEIVSSGDGLDANADVRVTVPAGKRVAVYLGAGEATVENVEGDLLVDVAAARVTTNRTRGRLTLDTGSGEVRVTDAQGDVDLDTGSGGVEVTNVRGTMLRLDTGSGRVRGSGISADEVELDTGSGSVQVTGVRARRISLDTGSGGIEVGLAADVESLRIDSGSGRVTVGIPEDLGAQLTIDTGSGGIDLGIPVQVRRAERNFLSGSIGDGKGEIRIETGSGGVTLRRN